jgi:16S rRNA G527 N7-methylase RsmG
LHAVNLEQAFLDLISGGQVPGIRLKRQSLLHLLDPRLPINYLSEVHLRLPLVILYLLSEVEELVFDVGLTLVEGLLDLSEVDLRFQSRRDFR